MSAYVEVAQASRQSSILFIFAGQSKFSKGENVVCVSECWHDKR